MTTDNLTKAILSMDAYNRGYDAGIVFGNNPGNNYSDDSDGIKVGKYTITQNSSELLDSDGNKNIDTDIGFYALAYEYNGETIISYRGTDYPKNDNLIPKDIYHGWTLGAGDTSSEQGQMAVTFYKEVAGDDNYKNANISLTGHSLGYITSFILFSS